MKKIYLYENILEKSVISYLGGFRAIMNATNVTIIILVLTKFGGDTNDDS